MKIKSALLGAALAGSMLVANAAQASTLINGSFETGDLTGWTASPPGLVSVLSGGAPGGGSYYADLYAGAGANVYTTLSQTFTLAAGQTLTGWAQWRGHDYLPFNDDGFVALSGPSLANLYAADIATYGNFGSSDWTQFSYKVGASGTYTLTAGVRNVLDNGLSSELAVDNFSISGVPETSTWVMMLAGFAGLGFAGYRRNKAASVAA